MSTIIIMEILNRIEKKALELYGKYGVKAMTMDDIARSCGISKKTLYENYANKKELVEDIVTKITANLHNNYGSVSQSADDAIMEVLLSLQNIETFCRRINYIMFEDLQKYYYESWEVIMRFRTESGFALIAGNIDRGIAEGVYHDRFDKDLIAQMRLQQLINIHERAHLSINLHDTLYQTSLHYLTGLATEKGNKLILEHSTTLKIS